MFGHRPDRASLNVFMLPRSSSLVSGIALESRSCVTDGGKQVVRKDEWKQRGYDESGNRLERAPGVTGKAVGRDPDPKP